MAPTSPSCDGGHLPRVETSPAAHTPHGWKVAGGILLLLGTMGVVVSSCMARVGARTDWVLAVWLVGLASLPLGLNFGVRDPLHLRLPKVDRELAMVVGILMVAALVRAPAAQTWAEAARITEIPLQIRNALDGAGSPLSRDSSGIPLLFYFAALPVHGLAGGAAVAMAWGAASEGLLSLLLLHLVLRRLIPIPLAAGVTLAVALIPWQVAPSYTGFVQVQAVVWTLVLLYMLLRALDSGRSIEYVLAGYLGGVCLMIYPAALIGPALAVLVLVARWARRRDFPGRQARGLVISVLGALAVTGPLVP